MIKEIKKAISLIVMFTMIFQIGMPMISGLNTNVLAVEDINNIETSGQNEIKNEETWDISANGDGSVIAKWSLGDKTLTISGTGKMKDWYSYSEEDWHNTQYTNLIESVIISSGVTGIGDYAFSGCGNLKNINISNSVKSIGRITNSIFYKCSSLSSINVNSENKYYSSDNGVLYNKEKTKILKYPEGKKDITTFEIPSSVIEIGESAFENCTGITNIKMSDNVKEIEQGAFSYCENLLSINLSKAITVIESNLFEECNSLKNIDIPNTVTTIEQSAFFSCDDLENTKFSSGLTSIGTRAFEDCVSLKEVVLPETVVNIGNRAFQNCTNLKNIEMPKNLENVGENLLFNNAKIQYKINNGATSIEIPSIVKRAMNTDDILYANDIQYTNCSIDDGKLILDTQNGNVLIEINSGVLKGLTVIILTNTWDISQNKDNSVKAVLSDDGTLTISGNGKMKNWTESSDSEWRISKESIYKVIIEKGVENIGDYAFYACINLRSVELAEGLKSIGNYAFAGDFSGYTIGIDFGEYDIKGCTQLKNIELPNGIVEIGEEAFHGSGLTQIEIPSTVSNIGDRVFRYCKDLTSIEVDENNINYSSKDGILFDKEKNELIQYPMGKKDIKEYEIPETVKQIDTGAFYCSKLSKIKMFNNVNNIENMAFMGATLLQDITLSTNIEEIGKQAFYACLSLQEIKIPKNVKTIDWGTFEECNFLEKIVIPSNVIKINDSAIDKDSSVTIYCKTGSIAQKYAIENNKNYIIDDVAPTVKFTSDSVKNIKKEHNVIIEVQDDMEEVGLDENSLKYQWTQSKEGPAKESFTENFENGQTITKNTGDGDWYLWVYAEDNLGNEIIARSEAFYFDNTAPSVNVEYSTKEITKENVMVTIKSNEEIQEMTGWTLSSDKKTLTKEYNVNTKETITVKDIAGNEKQATIEINNIDKIAPTVNVGYSTKNPTRGNVKVTITSNEEIQTVIGWTLSSDKKTLTKEYSANTKETITVKDIAGNETQANIEISNIDKNLPETTIGDINQDGKIDVTDLLMLKRHLVAGNRSEWKLTGDSLVSADMNENGTIDITDMLMLKRKIVENI